MNLFQIVHRVNDSNQEILIDHQWEISDPILPCNSQDTLPLQFFSYPDEIANRFHVWDFALPLAIVPQVHHYPKLVEWCVERYSSENRSILTYESNQIFLTISKEDIIKTLRLEDTNLIERNTVTLSKEILVHKFSSYSPSEQLDFVQSLQRPYYILSTLNFQIKSDTCHATVRNILSMYTQVFGQVHDHTLTKAFVNFLKFLAERVKFDYSKQIADTMHQQLSNFSTLSVFTYQAYLMYMILERYSLSFQSMMDVEDPTPYQIIYVVHKSPFMRNVAEKFSLFVNTFAAKVCTLLFETTCPRVTSTLQECLHPSTEDWIGDWFLSENYTVIKVYGFDRHPYRLPAFLTPRIFSMEVIRERFHVDFQHFSGRKQASSIKLPITIGPFTIKSKEVINLIDDIMASFKFPIDVACQYDPYDLIANKKKKLKRGNY